jgi:hypothetical protein
MLTDYLNGYFAIGSHIDLIILHRRNINKDLPEVASESVGANFFDGNALKFIL